jgi:hypothetical protein
LGWDWVTDGWRGGLSSLLFGLVRPGNAGLAQPAGKIGGKLDHIPGFQQRAGMGMGFLKFNELRWHGLSLL